MAEDGFPDLDKGPGGQQALELQRALAEGKGEGLKKFLADMESRGAKGKLPPRAQAMFSDIQAALENVVEELEQGRLKEFRKTKAGQSIGRVRGDPMAPALPSPRPPASGKPTF